VPTYEDILDQDDGALTADEANYVRRILRRGSTVEVPTAVAIDAALSGLDGARRRETEGGATAAKFDAVRERWALRNDLRVLLGFAAEPLARVGVSVAVTRPTACSKVKVIIP
jgi:hypothetical protein